MKSTTKSGQSIQQRAKKEHSSTKMLTETVTGRGDVISPFRFSFFNSGGGGGGSSQGLISTSGLTSDNVVTAGVSLSEAFVLIPQMRSNSAVKPLGLVLAKSQQEVRGRRGNQVKGGMTQTAMTRKDSKQLVNI